MQIGVRTQIDQEQENLLCIGKREGSNLSTKNQKKPGTREKKHLKIHIVTGVLLPQ